MTRVGVTGHRVLADTDRVLAGIDIGIERIVRRFGCEQLLVISTLAEGADQLVVRRLLAREGARLVGVLPLPEAEYAADFATGYGRESFARALRRAERVVRLPLASTRAGSYLAGGQYILDHCDVLLAIWDGRKAQGVGGTGDIVERARNQRLPLCWVRAGNRVPGTTIPTTLGSDQGVVAFENI